MLVTLKIHNLPTTDSFLLFPQDTKDTSNGMKTERERGRQAAWCPSQSSVCKLGKNKPHKEGGLNSLNFFFLVIKEAF
jgi:hypothetical protein